jgi:uncharacterized protein YbjT (DUF2867 family)
MDKEDPHGVACLAPQHGTPAYVLNSFMGANMKSRFFYTRVVGEGKQVVSELAPSP